MLDTRRYIYMSGSLWLLERTRCATVPTLLEAIMLPI